MGGGFELPNREGKKSYFTAHRIFWFLTIGRNGGALLDFDDGIIKSNSFARGVINPVWFLRWNPSFSTRRNQGDSSFFNGGS